MTEKRTIFVEYAKSGRLMVKVWTRESWVTLALVIAMLGGSALAQPTPSAGVSSERDLLGSTVELVASFTNIGSSEGYGPYLDVLLPTSPDPLNFAGATYLGQPLVPLQIALDASGLAQHPFALDSGGAPVQVTGPPGGTLLVFVLPFGSVTNGQPSIDVDISLEISQEAEPYVDIPVVVVPGFRYGATPLDDAGTDPHIRGGEASGTVTPELVRFEKRLVAPEGDTPVGESFTHRYEIELLVAPGQTLENIVIADVLPNALVIRGGSLGVSVNGNPLASPGGYTTSFDVVSQGSNGGAVPAPFPAGNTGPYADSRFEVALTGSATAPSGTPGSVLVTYAFYYPLGRCQR